MSTLEIKFSSGRFLGFENENKLNLNLTNLVLLNLNLMSGLEGSTFLQTRNDGLKLNIVTQCEQ